MNFRLQIALLFSVATLTAAQSVSDLPSCASSGALSAIASSGCAATDTSCICNSPSFKTALSQFAKANCNDADYNTALTVGSSLCAKAGVQIVVTTTTVPSGGAIVDPTITTPATGMPTVSVSVVTTTTTEHCGCEDADDTPTIAPNMTAPMITAPIAPWTGAASRDYAGISQIFVVAGGVLGLMALL